MRYLIFSDNQYEEARIMSSLSKLKHTWVPHNKASASVTHIIVHPDLEALSPTTQKLILELKQKCRADVLCSQVVVDPNVTKRPDTPDKVKDRPVVEQNCSSGKERAWEHPVTVFSTRKITNVDPSATYMAPRQWIKMLPNDDDDGQAPWAEQMASQSDQLTQIKHHKASHASNVTFKDAVNRVMMANAFGESFKSTRQKRVEGTSFHEKFKNRTRLTQADTPDALSRRLSELDEALVAKRKHDKENALRAREVIHQDRKHLKVQSKKQAVMLFQPMAGKFAMKLAGKSIQRRATKVFPVQLPKSTSPKVTVTKPVYAPSPSKKPQLVVPAPPDPLTRWRTKTAHRMTGMTIEESPVTDASKISFADAADAIESVEVERHAALNKTEPRRPSRNRLLDRLKQIQKPSCHKATFDKLHISASEVRGVHKTISMWSELRGDIKKPPGVVRRRPHTAPTRPSSRAVNPLPPGVLTPTTPSSARLSSREPTKVNNIELIHESILHGCSIQANPV